ncbi:WD40 repeat [Streptomyces sp. Ncost-T6T-1]|uniref:nSTAND1 domain-containing NTPase n=1 Tax=Streptomyces sp. Ncost-T6T-1 TaxID=1100828 RepID=UPI0008055657|nr:helix-turn-helix domain-containing protein [Streptomyces sp. Ncost-T6T-1]SBU91952.1 WD40 repeat [Streptomyces sp. Ncost-T6T-1]
MGRRERQLEPTEGPVPRFAYELRKLRRQAGGITYREMAAKAHYSAATLAQAAAGERLPSLPVALAYVRACDGDPEEWTEQWRQAEREVAAQALAGTDEAEAPYPGLARFGTDDRERYFGRDRLIDELAELVDKRLVTLLVGASGSGKSSLLRAGLIPRLRAARPPHARPSAIRILTPGPHPAGTHAPLLAPEAMRNGSGGGAEAVVIVDQFEELFTLCADPTERARFVDLLLTAAAAGPGARVVLALRADFYGHCARHRLLAEAVKDSVKLVTPMGPDELREAIVKPAATAGLLVERALTARIIDEVADEPGGLPLMSHALLEIWRRRRGRTLTESAYDAAGGIQGAIAHTAETLYDGLTPRQAEVARDLLLRLVTPGQGAPDTRRPTDPGAFIAGHPAEAAVVLERLARARLITLDEDVVDLAHEALLTSWPRLRDWIAEDRERLRQQHLLADAAADWELLDRDPGALYRGARLATAEEHFTHAPRGTGGLTAVEKEFLAESVSARHRERQRGRKRTSALVAVLVLALVAGLVAWQQNRTGERRRVESEARRIAAVAASLRQSDPVTSMRLSRAAWDLAELPETRSALLSGMAQKERDAFTDPDEEVRTMRRLSADGRTLLSIGARQVTEWDVGTHRRRTVMPGLGGELGEAGVPRGDTRSLPMLSNGKVVVRDLATGRRTGASPGPANAGAEMAASGRTLITYNTSENRYGIRLQDMRSGKELLTLREKRDPRAAAPPVVQSLADVNRLLMEERVPAAMEDRAFPDATVSADDRHLALCVPGKPLQVWDVAERRRLSTPWAPEVTADQCLEESIHFTPDGRHLALTTGTGVRIWAIATGRERPEIRHTDLRRVAFSADGEFLVGEDGAEILLWRLRSAGYPVLRYRLSGGTATDLRVDPDEGWIRYLSGREDSWGTEVHTLDLGRVGTARWRNQPFMSTVFSPDGALIATTHLSADNRTVHIRTMDGRTGEPLSDVLDAPCRTKPDFGPPEGQCRPLIAFNSTGTRLILAVKTSAADEPARWRATLWDTVRRRDVDSFDATKAVAGFAGGIAFGPHDRYLLLSDALGPGSETRMWDLATRTTTRTLPDVAAEVIAVNPAGTLFVNSQGQAVELPSGKVATVRSPGKARALAFSTDGRYFAVGERSGRATLWDGRLQQRLGVLVSPDAATHRYVSALAFSPDGGILAVASEENIQLWDTASNQPIGSALPSAGDTVLSLSFAADGNTLYAAGANVPFQKYDISTGRAVETVCRRARGGLSRSDWADYVREVPYRETCP